MKKLIIALSAIAISMPALAGDLPFVGKRYFNFLGGSGTGYSINIAANGDTVIESHGTHASEVVYRGKYQAVMPERYDGKVLGYFKMAGKHIHQLDKNKRLTTGCNVENEQVPCVSQLYE